MRLRKFIGVEMPQFKKTLSLKIILTFLIVIIFSTSITSVMFYLQATKYINTQNEMHDRNVTKNISNSMDRYLEDMDRVSKIVIGNPEVQRILLEGQSDSYPWEQKQRDMEYITNLVLSFVSIRDSLSINLYGKDVEKIYTGLYYNYDFGINLKYTDWMKSNQQAINTEGSYIIPPNAVDHNQPSRLFGVIRSLRKMESNEVIGYITVTSDVRVLNNIIYTTNSFSGNEQIEIVDKEASLLHAVSIGKENIDKAKMRRIAETSELSGWTIVMYLPSSYSSSDLMNVQTVRNYLLSISSLVIVGSFILAIILSRYLLKPIRHFVKSMRLVRRSNFDIVLDEKGLDFELKQLYSGFNTMIAEIKKLINNISDEKLLARSAKMEALQFQITPHFLYNTLQTMEAIGEVKEVPEIQTIAQSLGKLFRYNIHGGNTVHLYEELEQIVTYFTIERIRFRDKIICEIQVSEQLRHYKVLKFILQPIVENCVLHGFKNINYKGVISVGGYVQDHRLILYVKDNGRGISQQRLSYIDSKLHEISTSQQDVKSNEFVGILNVHKRLVNYYGSGYGLHYSSTINAGTTVELILPIIMDE
ncbi:histidine kinase [Paenibacillus sp. WQ 127069]|uniref:Histidine kinase n=1 Tax=Paenibacillus baimaensis TaxID=2982185 RepID=A0ABT2UP75_9BACL|nr:histidine kinase [Paenibacillus sp. WQ 127069]MCU6796448.1 histidine kinase [Paenibacillus sp. WQ 127069]